MNIHFVGAFDPDYPRNQIIITGLERVGFAVTSTNLPPKQGTFRKMAELTRRRHELRTADVLLIPAFNQLLAPFIWLLAKVLRKPIILDYMIGLTDAIVEERAQATTLKRLLYRQVDCFNMARIPSFTDTAAHIDAFQRILNMRPTKMSVLPVGVYDLIYFSRPLPDRRPLLVQFFGNYLPFHGVDVILDAASEFQGDPRVQFELIGRGQMYQAAISQAAALALDNVTFVDPIPPDKLPERVAQAAICLGVFGARPKTDYVVPNKVYQCMSIGRPVITAESTALNEMFTAGEHLITIPPGDCHALAQAIRALIDDETTRNRIGAAAAECIEQNFLPQHSGALLKKRIEQMSTHRP